ncbi:hypothetical protein S7711_06646 [Stachybotrys chartarum IBT 7711]|uniref:LEM-like domain-containing protein n=1 Tax=Stachybotrys chartarum (strain CBS 109288 / IBT 7711) TaxID=1280523 RepID=A0A084AL10_STACB|nr:hypothetical protein S7711_06646 [Stachybotrys chartarum IBT 7711]
MADADDYLQDGFDPRSVTVPRLRSILVTHNIDFPGIAKKPQLVSLVTDHVLSQAPKLRAQRERAKRSSFGIVNAGSAEDRGDWADHDLHPPSTVKRARSPRKASAKIKSEDDEPVPPALSSPVKRGARSTSRPLPHVADQEEPSTAKARRTRRTITPQIKSESGDEELAPTDGEESVFTDDNPFQGGGSSPPQNKTPTNRRRTTTGGEVSKSAKSSRRQTDGVITDFKTPKSSAAPVARFRQQGPEAFVEPGEEFTPDEQLELEEAASKGEVTIVPRKLESQVARRSGFKIPLFTLLVTLLGAYSAWYRQEKIAVGYCGLGRPAKTILPPEIDVPDAILPFIEPQCEQCPPHAYCYEDFSARCEPDFILRPHPLSLGGLVPLPPTCEPDGEKARRVKAVADKAVEELRDRRAKFECGELVDEEGQRPDSPAIAEDELKESVSIKRSKRMNSDEFNDLWAAAIGEVTTRDEVVVVETVQASDSTGLPVRRLSSTSLARLPLTCAVKRSVRLGVARYRLPIGFLMLVALGIAYLRARYRNHVKTVAQIPALVDLVLARLATQKELGEEDLDDPWLFLPNLRDDVLRSVHNISERQRIWQRVKAVVEQNSNVRTSQREGRSGEIGRAWEWIGPMAGEAARRRRSGRVSWGGDVKPESPAPQETPEVKKWDDPRPLY